MLNFSYTSKSDIPKGAEGFYTEIDGAFVLQVDGTIPDKFASPLNTALADERKKRRDAESEAKKLKDKYGLLPEDFDIAEFNRLKDSDPSKELDAKLAEQRDRINKQFEKRIEELNKSLGEKDGLISKHIKDSALQKAMADVNIGKAFIPAVSAMFKDQVTLEGENVLLNERPVTDFLKEWVASESGKAFVSAPMNTGGGASGKSGSGAQKTVTRAEFDKMSQSERHATIKGGAKVVD